MKKKILIPVFLAAMALPLCLHHEPVGINAEFIGEYSERAAYIQHGMAVNAQLADEGFVLLKNDGTLPLDDGARISIVGKASIDLARGGAGSGAGSVSSGVTSIDLQKSLTDVGFEVNPVTTAFYNSSASGSGRTNGNNNWQGNSEVTIGETDIEKVRAASGLLDSFDEYNDAAIQVITREGSEGCDVKTCNTHDSIKTHTSSKKISDKHALELSDNEQALFDELHEHFDHIIIVINSSNIFECDQFEKDDQVAGVLWIGNPGDVGPGAVGRILKGDVNPSGRTVDTWTRDFTKDPSFQNFSDNAQTNEVTLSNGDIYYAPQDTMFAEDGAPMLSFGTDKNYKAHNAPRWDSARGGQEAQVVSGGINGVKPASYVSYEEGIYVDYRYYETRYADMAKEDKAAADAWYDGEEGVVYPFGFGLSYTTFEQKIIKSSIKKGSTVNKDQETIAITVEVTNTGDVAGKEAVQLYFKAPYKTGEIEKADHVLCAFGKSEVIQPGEKGLVHLSFYLQDVANYDFSDANNNGFKGYELDAGDYELFLGKNAHESYDNFKFKVAENIQYENDRFSGNKVENRFTDRGFYNSMPGEDDIEFTQMSRADFEGTFPTHPTIEDRTVKSGSRFEEFLTYEFSLADFEDGNDEYVPAAARKDASVAEGWKQGSTDTNYKIIDLKDADLDDERWEDLVNQMSWADMLKVVETNRMASQSISSVGKSSFSEGDGPQKFNIIWWVSSPIIAATFNPELAHEQGECVGMESHISGKSGWWGPAVNTHRSPFGGRNFEYYSADPFLMGRMAANVVSAATDRGVYAYFKHFATNDQEKNRESGISFVNEQALREIYLKSFQMVFEEGKSMGVMGSYNRLGLMETAASYPLLTEVLRGEWGFKGSVLSDMTHSGNSSINNNCYECVTNRVLAGCNAQLDSGGFSGASQAKWDSTLNAPCYTKDGQKVISYSYWYAVRQCVKEHMYMSSRCTGTNRGLTQVLGQDYKEVEARTDFEYNVEIEGADSVRLNQRVELPKGIIFEDGTLSGQFANEGIYYIDFIGESSNGVVGAFKLIVRATTNGFEVTDDEEAKSGGKKGCGGSIIAASSIMALVAGLGFALLAVDKKRAK